MRKLYDLGLLGLLLLLALLAAGGGLSEDLVSSLQSTLINTLLGALGLSA